MQVCNRTTTERPNACTGHCPAGLLCSRYSISSSKPWVAWHATGVWLGAGATRASGPVLRGRPYKATGPTRWERGPGGRTRDGASAAPPAVYVGLHCTASSTSCHHAMLSLQRQSLDSMRNLAGARQSSARPVFVQSGAPGISPKMVAADFVNLTDFCQCMFMLL